MMLRKAVEDDDEVCDTCGAGGELVKIGGLEVRARRATAWSPHRACDPCARGFERSELDRRSARARATSAALALLLVACNTRLVDDRREQIVVERYPLATRVVKGQPGASEIGTRGSSFAYCDDDEVTLSGGCYWETSSAIMSAPALDPDGVSISGWYCESAAEPGAVTAYAVCGR